MITIATKIDYVPKSKVLNVVSNIKKQFGGIVLPFSAVDSRYNEKIFEALEDIINSVEK